MVVIISRKFPQSDLCVWESAEHQRAFVHTLLTDVDKFTTCNMLAQFIKTVNIRLLNTIKTFFLN